ncbi:MAG: O-antigen ligase family protein [Candidatus Aminicenantes bacterium]|nr:O-antigen ligase family protein [Candidatus Aminicenantes bacterium]
MKKHQSNQFLFIFFIILYSAILLAFYLKYVPLVLPFQLFLLPVLLTTLVLTVINLEKGLLLFVFMFPLVNSLPYFFGIYEQVPHAPTALLVFLFFFLGFLIHRCFSPSLTFTKTPISTPMIILAMVLVLSGFITFLRYSNFFPFLVDSIYELTVNVNGVSAGGAIMSTLFSALNYLSGFIFFFILYNILRKFDILEKILQVLLASTFLSLLFGLLQFYKDIRLGNTPFWVRLEQINSTFKDPNSFGIFLAVFFPLLIALILTSKGLIRLLSLLSSALVLFVLPKTGTRSALLGILLSILLFGFFLLRHFKIKKMNFFKMKAAKFVIPILLGALLLAGYFGLNQSRVMSRIKSYAKGSKGEISIIGFSPERFFLWKEAISMMKDYPAAGVGVGAYIIELPNYYTKNLGDYKDNLEGYRRNDSAENYFLHIGAETGLMGLFLVLWLFFMLFRSMYRAGRAIEIKEKQLIYFGAVAGITAYVFTLLFHSYVGSPEVKYIFWLLVAIALSPVIKKSGQEQDLKTPKTVKIGSILLIALFGIVFLWNSTHSLSLRHRYKEFDLNQNFGLGKTEQTEDGRIFQWTREYGGLPLKITRPIIQIPLLASHPDIKENPVTVKIFLVKDFFKEKMLLGEIVMTKEEWKTYEFELSPALDQDVLLLFKVSRTWNPQKALGVPDPRNLGVAIGSIQFHSKD